MKRFYLRCITHSTACSTTALDSISIFLSTLVLSLYRQEIQRTFRPDVVYKAYNNYVSEYCLCTSHIIIMTLSIIYQSIYSYNVHSQTRAHTHKHSHMNVLTKHKELGCEFGEVEPYSTIRGWRQNNEEHPKLPSVVTHNISWVMLWSIKCENLGPLKGSPCGMGMFEDG